MNRPAMMTGGRGKKRKIGRSKISERIHFQITPEVFDRIEFWSVGRQREYMEIRRFFNEGLYFVGTMRQESIPNQHHRHLELPT